MSYPGSGTSCASDGNNCTTDACNGSGGCAHTRTAPPGLGWSRGGQACGAFTVAITLSWSQCSDASHYDVQIERRINGVYEPYFTYQPSSDSPQISPGGAAAPTGGSKVFYAPVCPSTYRFRVRSYNGTHSAWSSFFSFTLN